MVERGGLENRCRGNPPTEGSNPSPSANGPYPLVDTALRPSSWFRGVWWVSVRAARNRSIRGTVFPWCERAEWPDERAAWPQPLCAIEATNKPLSGQNVGEAHDWPDLPPTTAFGTPAFLGVGLFPVQLRAPPI